MEILALHFFFFTFLDDLKFSMLCFCLKICLTRIDNAILDLILMKIISDFLSYSPSYWSVVNGYHMYKSVDCCRNWMQCLLILIAHVCIYCQLQAFSLACFCYTQSFSISVQISHEADGSCVRYIYTFNASAENFLFLIKWSRRFL